MKKGFLVAGIILTAIGLGLCIFENYLSILAIYYHFHGSASNQIGSALVMATLGIMMFILQLVFNIAGGAVVGQAIGSSVKGIKIAGIIFLILNVLMIILSTITLVWFLKLSNSTSTETSMILNFLKISL